MSSRHSLHSGLAFVVIALASAGCATPAALPRGPARPPPTVPSEAPPRAASTTDRPDVEALSAALKAKGHTVVPQVDATGRVRGLEYRQWEREATFVNAYPEPYVVAFMKAHGDALGYGRLGDPADDVAMNDETFRGPATLVVPYPKAEGCPGLTAIFRYSYATDVTGLVGIPMGWQFVCPTEANGIEQIQKARERTTDVHASREVTAAIANDPLVKWLTITYGRPTSVFREPESVRVHLPAVPASEKGSPASLAKEVAEHAAALSGLPKLDKATPHYTEATRDRPKQISKVVFTESKPSGSACLAPSVVVLLRVPYEPSPQTPAALDAVEVHCAREVAGPRPPADAARTLPRTFATSPEYLVHCNNTSFAWGYSNTGLVVDRRGDVYSYSGGEPSEAKTVSALREKLRHGNKFEGTLLPADVEELVALVPKVAKDKVHSQEEQTFDGPSGSCAYFLPGASKDALVTVPLRSFDDRRRSFRDGEATRAAQRVLRRALTLSSRGL